MTLQQLFDSTTYAHKVLTSLKPSKSQEEYAHLLLMSEIRLQYLETYLIQDMLNKTTSNTAEYPAIAMRLKKLVDKSTDLDKRFIELNKNSFYLGELQTENQIRSHQLIALYDRVARNRGFSKQPEVVPN